MKLPFVPSLALLLALAPAGASSAASAAPVHVRMIDAKGSPVGRAVVTELERGGVQVELELENLPAGRHALHFHEKGECQTPNFESAGAHFNPEGRPHGLSHKEGGHAGDMPNITIRRDGGTKTTVLNHKVTLKAGENSLLKAGGTALVLHADADDHASAPAGKSGGRIACGEILSLSLR